MQQRSDEWFSARIGKVTASRVSDLMAKIKSGYAASRKNYMIELLIERLTRQKYEGFTSKEMQWGIDHEDEARTLYEAQRFVDVEQVGFIDHPEIPMFGASPDGLIDLDGGLEIKCPNSATHIDTLLYGTIKNEYMIQMHVGMMCTGRKWWDFVSYDPRFHSGNSIRIIRIERDEKLCEQIKEEVLSFLSDLDDMLDKVKLKESA